MANVKIDIRNKEDTLEEDGEILVEEGEILVPEKESSNNKLSKIQKTLSKLANRSITPEKELNLYKSDSLKSYSRVESTDSCKQC